MCITSYEKEKQCLEFPTDHMRSTVFILIEICSTVLLHIYIIKSHIAEHAHIQ